MRRRNMAGKTPMKIHVAIVSDQTLANLIPILMDRPDKVYLACSETMKSRGLDGRIERLLRQEGVSVETKCDAPNAGLGAIRAYADSLAAGIRQAHPDAEIVLNATGGTKLMSLGFVEVFRDIARNIIYTDTSHRRIELFPDISGAAVEPVEMRNVLDVQRYLAAQGFRYLSGRSDDPAWCQQTACRQAASMYLGQEAQATQMQVFIGRINRLANLALGEPTSANADVLREPVQSFETVPKGRWATALTRMNQADLIDWREHQPQLRFKDAQSARFLRGGWLEEYAWHVVKAGGVWDVRCSVEVTPHDASHTRNEFDVLACHSNELLVIECKTLRYQEENENQIAYKIDSLGQQVRGLFGETWLLSARQPPDTLLERARLARIRIIGPAELPGLPSAVRDWMKGPNLREAVSLA
jgi:hypothetical protein